MRPSRNDRGRYGGNYRNRGAGNYRPGWRSGGRSFVYNGYRYPALRVTPFYYPRGYSYRYWYPGDFLPALFLSAQFFFYDYYALGINPPPPGYRWVRYGPDLLLVDLYTDEVVDVVYGAFYW